MQLQQKIRTARLAWPELFLWVLLGIPLLHLGLLFSITDSHTPQAIAIQALRPLGTLGAVVLLCHSASLTKGHRRWAWIFYAASMFFGALFSIHLITQETSAITPLTNILPMMIYLFALLGTALYLRPRSRWIGNTPRVASGSITVGCSALVLMESILPTVFPTLLWNAKVSSILPYLALDVGILFALGVVGLRYGLHQGPLVPLAFLCILCLLIADTLYLLVSLVPGSAPIYVREFPLYPLYTLQSVLLAFAAYRDVTYRKQVLPTTAQAMSLLEWSLWTFVPLVSVLMAFIATSTFGRVPFSLLAGLLLIVVIHEALAAFDYRRVLHNLQQANSELAQANSELSKAHEQVRATASTMEAFVARIVHDLAPPVQGLLSAVRDASWREDQHYLQHIVAGQVALLEAFVHQARAYIMARTVTLKCSKLDVLPICLSAVAAARPRAEQRSVQIVQDILVESPTVFGDETAVRRILDNLLTNAVGISPRGGEVTLTLTAPTPQQLEISVSDQGPGIPAEKQAQLFKPYTSLQFPSLKDQSRSRSPTGTGMGLGLAIVKELSQALGGECGVISVPNAGSTFYVRLPVEPTASLLVLEKEPDAHGAATRHADNGPAQ